MSNPAVTALTKNVWTKVATGIVNAHLWSMKKGLTGSVVYTYRNTGEAAPSDLSDAIVLQKPGVHINFDSPIDIWVYAKSASMSVRVDIGSGSVRQANPEHINKFGENNDIDAASVPETIWSVGGVFPFQASGVSLELFCVNAADDIAGTGAQKVEIQLQKTDLTHVTLTVDTNGAGTTVIPGGAVYLMPFRAENTQTGANDVNVGNITIRIAGAGATLAEIPANEGQTLMAVYPVELGKKAIIKRVWSKYSRTVGATNSARLRLRLKKQDGSLSTKYNFTLTSNAADDNQDYDIGGIEASEGETFFIECVFVSADNTPVEAGFDVELKEA